MAKARKKPQGKPKKDEARESRISMEIVVDAYDESERAMGWYYYLEDKLTVPFSAKCIATKAVSPLKKGESVEVLGMAPEESCENDMLVTVRWQDRETAVPLSQLSAEGGDESTVDAIGDWHYWAGQGYFF